MILISRILPGSLATMVTVAVLGCVLCASCASAAAADAFRPSDDSEVLERLPAPNDPRQREFRQLRQALSEDPGRLEPAIALARRSIAIGRAEADPRYYGYAEAALKPWWNLESPPPDALVLRAVVHQSRHDFGRALEDLSLVLKRQPAHPQALLTQAFVLQAMGRYGDALQSCRRLPRAIGRLVLAACAGRVLSLTGEAERAYELLRRALDASPKAETDLRLWVLTNLAEIATHLGKFDLAEQHFRDALDLGNRDTFLLGAYTDFLLDRDRSEEVRSLLRDRTRADALLLRLAIAEKRLGGGAAVRYREALQARFDASRLRGNAVHLREEARFNLEVLDRPDEALRLAEANWAVQKEPADALLVLKAALAAGEPERARPVGAWLRDLGMEHVAVDALVLRLQRGRDS